MTALALFASTFFAVFALGFQSLNVNRGHYVAAFLTSFVIAGGNLVLFKVVPGALSTAELVAYFTGGPLAIVCSMFVHRRTIGRRVARLSDHRRYNVPPRRNPPSVDRPCITVAEARALDDAGEHYFDLRGGANINCGADRP